MSDWFGKLSQLFTGEPQDQEQLLEMLRDAQSRSVLTAELLSMIEGVLHIAEIRVRDVMVPRQQMVVIHAAQSLDETVDVIISSGHSRFPVIQSADTENEVVGLLHSKDILSVLSKKAPFVLADCVRPLMMIPETKTLDTLLWEFKSSHRHMAVVVDEYGHMTGLVTIEDVLEQIVGDIGDEHDLDEEDTNIVEQAGGAYLIQAHTTLEEFNEYFQCDFAHDEFNTVGGIVLHQFGRMPQRGDTVELPGGFHFTVVKSDKRRVYQVELTRVTAEKS